MKKLFLLFLIVLLPLRGWAGDAVSMRMVSAGMPSALTAHGVDVVTDCPMHAAMQEKLAQQAPHEGKDAGDKHCASCDLCLPFAALHPTRLDFFQPTGEAKPLAGVDDFLSAALAPMQKPPIF